MQLTEKHIQDYKDLFKKEYGKDPSDQEASDWAYNLVGFVELLMDGYIEDQKRKKRLETEPKGFHLEGIGYTCFVCGASVSNEESWYDKHGIKCLICQRAINHKEVPASVASDSESWYSKRDMERYFCLKTPTLRSWIKAGILKERKVTNDGKGVRVELFLIKDNKDFLPPKKLVESHSVKEVRNGEDWYHSEPWYKFADPYEHLKGYKIMDYLRIVPIEEAKLNGTPSIT